MIRKTFIRLSSALIAAPFLSPICSWAQNGKLKNWAGNIEYSTENVFYPKTMTEVQQLVKKFNKLRALGTRHCFNRIADSRDNLI
jgi:xylitol oxidase